MTVNSIISLIKLILTNKLFSCLYYCIVWHILGQLKNQFLVLIGMPEFCHINDYDANIKEFGELVFQIDKNSQI
jgi:hypothetical protein